MEDTENKKLMMSRENRHSHIYSSGLTVYMYTDYASFQHTLQEYRVELGGHGTCHHETVTLVNQEDSQHNNIIK